MAKHSQQCGLILGLSATDWKIVLSSWAMALGCSVVLSVVFVWMRA